MQESLRPVSVGFFFGLLSLIFGIFWAIYLVAGHESIHKTLEERGRAARAAMEEKFVTGSEAGGAHEKGNGHSHESAKDAEVSGGYAGVHEDPLMDEAHERLTRGHLHAMGLGLVSIAVSFLLSQIAAPNFIKTLGSACIGIGGFFYPFSWIVMGFRTTAMGDEAAAESVLPIVAFSVPLVLLGLFLTIFFLVFKGFGKGR